MVLVLSFVLFIYLFGKEGQKHIENSLTYKIAICHFYLINVK